MFEALPAALLEIHTGMMASAILSDTIPCERLCIEAELETVLEATDSVFGKSPEIRETLAAAVSTSND